MYMKKKKIIIISIIIIILIISSILIFLNYQEMEVTIKEKIEVPLNSKLTNLDNITNLKNGQIITDEKTIDTSKIGEQKINISIKNKLGKVKEYHYTVNVYDDEKPSIIFSKELTIEEGQNIDLLKDVKVEDNSQEKITPSVEGNYDINEPGKYQLYYVAKDSSDNEAKEEFTLIVKEKKKETTSNDTISNPQETKTFTTSKGFKGVIKDGITYIDGYLIVNKTYSLPSSYGTSLTSTTKNAFNKMQAAAKLDGINIYIASGFRSYRTQNRLYNNYVARDGKAKADTYSARPGHSEHQSGLAFDICSHDLDGQDACINSNFDNTDQAKWLAQNAYKYGFILRYPKGKTNETGYKYESWHFRYVGTDLSTKLYNNGDWLTMENYFGITSEY